jgi:hypothetical protein
MTPDAGMGLLAEVSLAQISIFADLGEAPRSFYAIGPITSG